jgi:hypothetical protein
MLPAALQQWPNYEARSKARKVRFSTAIHSGVNIMRSDVRTRLRAPHHNAIFTNVQDLFRRRALAKIDAIAGLPLLRGASLAVR